MVKSRKFLAFLCTASLVLAASMLPASAASTTGITSGGTSGKITVQAALSLNSQYGSASTSVPNVSPSPSVTTRITIYFVNPESGPGSRSGVGGSSASATAMDIPHRMTEATSTHSVLSSNWGNWSTSLTEIAPNTRAK